MAQSQKPDKDADPLERVLRELEMIRRLAIADLIDRGYSQADIADILNLSQPTISRMFPKGLPKKRGNPNG